MCLLQLSCSKSTKWVRAPQRTSPKSIFDVHLYTNNVYCFLQVSEVKIERKNFKTIILKCRRQKRRETYLFALKVFFILVMSSSSSLLFSKEFIYRGFRLPSSFPRVLYSSSLKYKTTLRWQNKIKNYLRERECRVLSAHPKLTNNMRYYVASFLLHSKFCVCVYASC